MRCGYFELLYPPRRDLTSVKVVNALLTQLDKLKHRKNILVVTTSNLADAIGTVYCLAVVAY